MVHLGVTLMMNLGMSALDQSLLFLNGNHNPLTRVSIRGNSQQSVRISLHHLQIFFSIQIPLGSLLPEKLLSYPRRKRRLTLLCCDGVTLPFLSKLELCIRFLVSLTRLSSPCARVWMSTGILIESFALANFSNSL